MPKVTGAARGAPSSEEHASPRSTSREQIESLWNWFICRENNTDLMLAKRRGSEVRRVESLWPNSSLVTVFPLHDLRCPTASRLLHRWASPPRIRKMINQEVHSPTSSYCHSPLNYNAWRAFDCSAQPRPNPIIGNRSRSSARDITMAIFGQIVLL